MSEMEIMQKYTTDASRFLMIEDCMIHYRVEGKGPPLMLVHGAFSSCHTFDEWTNLLKSKFTIIRFDIPGFGLSTGFVDKVYSINRFTRFMAKFLKRLNIPQVHLAGSSLGGWLSWEFTLKYPKMVNRLVLIDAAGFVQEDRIPLPIKMMRTPFVDKIVRFVIRKQTLEVFLREVFVHQDRITDEMIDRYYDLFTFRDNQESFFRLVNSKFVDRTRRLKEIQHPTLIMWGEQDAWVSIEDAYIFRDRIPNAELLIYEDLGHLPFEEAPKSTSKDLVQFLGRKSASKSAKMKAVS